MPAGIEKISALSGRRFWPWRALALGALAFAALGLVIVYSAGPVPPAWYPPCPLHATTGLLCPGCGSARTLHALAHGNLAAACGHNILIVIAAPFLLAWAALSLWRGLRRNLPPLRAPLGLAHITLVAVVVFMLARNLPWWPLTLLAP